MIRAALLCLFLSTAAAQAAGPAERAEAAARALEAATAQMQQATSGRAQIEALTRTLQAYEDGLLALREGLREVQLFESALTRQFAARSEDLTHLLSIIIATARLDDSIALVHPEGALETARADMLLSEMTPPLARDVADLREELEDLRALRRARQFGHLALEQGLSAAQDARVALAQAIADRGPLPKRLVDDPKVLEAYARDVATLDEFAASLTTRTALSADAPVVDLRNAKGTLPLPVRATLLRSFNQPDAAGVARPGMVLATLPEAVVTAPWSSTVRYAGPLSAQGNVVILEPTEGVLFVLVGLGTLLVETGAILAQDAILGSMPAASHDVEDSGNRNQTLYFEMREGGFPIDPEPWFDFTGPRE